MNNRFFEVVKTRIPNPTRRHIVHRRLAVRRAVSAKRALPDFLIIGGQRCGTSSLYKYLGAHPQIVPSLRKETRYFSIEYERGIDWYRAHFPMTAAMTALARLRGSSRTFEATPDYLLDPRAPSRVATTLPDTKLIAILRDPVARAYSHWRHMQRLGIETLSFEDAVASESDRIGSELQEISACSAGQFKSFFRFSYAARGCYAEQLERWLSTFSASQFLVLDAGDLYSRPKEVLYSICHFLEIEEWAPPDFRNYSRSGATGSSADPTYEIPEPLRSELHRYFSAKNADLPRIVGRQFQWI